MNPPLLAALHLEPDAVSGFLAGLRHPFSGLDHVLVMLAVGMWAAGLGGHSLWRLPLAFVAAMALGGALGMLGPDVPGVELAIELTGLGLLGLVLTGRRPAPAVAAWVVSSLAVLHGHAHGTELPSGASAWLYTAGFVAATGALLVAGIGLFMGASAARSRRGCRAEDRAGACGATLRAYGASRARPIGLSVS